MCFTKWWNFLWFNKIQHIPEKKKQPWYYNTDMQTITNSWFYNAIIWKLWYKFNERQCEIVRRTKKHDFFGQKHLLNFKKQKKQCSDSWWIIGSIGSVKTRKNNTIFDKFCKKKWLHNFTDNTQSFSNNAKWSSDDTLKWINSWSFNTKINTTRKISKCNIKKSFWKKMNISKWIFSKTNKTWIYFNKFFNKMKYFYKTINCLKIYFK